MSRITLKELFIIDGTVDDSLEVCERRWGGKQ